MNQILHYWNEFKSAFWNFISKVEESPQFDRVVHKYESLDLRHQKWIQAGGSLAGLLLLLYIFFAPLLSVWSQKSQNQDWRNLILNLQKYNAKYSVIHRPAPKPQGWQNLSATNVDELENSLIQYLATIGVPQDNYKLNKKPTGEFSIEMNEISLRQLVALNFELDGWSPTVRYDKLKVNVSSQAKDLLDVQTDFHFDAEAAAQAQRGDTGDVAGAGGPLPNTGGAGPTANAGGPDVPGAPNPGGAGGAPANPTNPEEFPGGDLPPPPPFEDEL